MKPFKPSPLTKVLVQRHIGGSEPPQGGIMSAAHVPKPKLPKMERFAAPKNFTPKLKI